MRHYFELVCPHSYILAHEVEEDEDEGLVEVERLPFGLKPAPVALSGPRGEYIRDHWRDHVYELAQNHGVEIRIPQDLAPPHRRRSAPPRGTLGRVPVLRRRSEAPGRA